MAILNRGPFRPRRGRQQIYSTLLVILLVLSIGSVAFASTIEREPSPPAIAGVLEAATTEFTTDATRLIERVRGILAGIRLPEIFTIELDWPKPFVAARLNDRAPTRAAQLAATAAVVSNSEASVPSAPAATATVIHQTINQPVVERIIERPAGNQNVIDAELSTTLTNLQRLAHGDFLETIWRSIGVSTESVARNSLSAQALIDANIPNDITVSNYLPLTGGTLSGDLAITGNFTVAGAQTLSGAITIPYLTATSTTASTFIQASTTRLSVFDTAYFGGTATSTFDASGNLTVAGTLGVTGKTTIGYASTTGITANHASTSALIASNSFTLANLSGFLKATAGAVATALINLASDVTGMLPVANGGTGWAAIESGAIPYGNGTGQLATTTVATAGYVLAYLNGVPTWTATTTLANISGTLGVGSGGTGATTFGHGWLYSTGGTSALAASTSPTVNYITATSTTATSTFAGSIAGPNNFVVQSSSGNVGIGKISPDAPLHVVTSDSATEAVLQRWESGAGRTLSLLQPDAASAADPFTFSTSNAYAFRVDATDALLIDSGGKIGIGTTPSYALDVVGEGSFSTSIYVGGAYFDPATSNVIASTLGDGYISVNRDSVSGFFGRTADGAIVQFRSAGSAEGNISVSGTTVSYNAFTGSHYAFVEGSPERGELVSLTGNNIQSHEGNDSSEPIYGARVSTNANDPNVLGSYLGLTEPEQPRSAENPELVMAVGNGFLWVVDNGEDIKVGDRLISSDLPGHAMRDPGTYEIAHVIARATDRVDWDDVTEAIDGKRHKIVSVTYELFDKDNRLAHLLDRLSASTTIWSSDGTADSSISGLFSRLTSWFADMSNGIVRFFAQEVRTRKLCVEDVCVSRDQFLKMVEQAGQASVPASPPVDTSAAAVNSEPTDEVIDLSEDEAPSLVSPDGENDTEPAPESEPTAAESISEEAPSIDPEVSDDLTSSEIELAAQEAEAPETESGQTESTADPEQAAAE
jgi:hypothetical protein